MDNNLSRYSFDKNTISHRGKDISTFWNTKKVDLLLENSEQVLTYEVGYVPAGYEHRPDLISNVFFGTPGYWWLLMLVNGVTDPFEGFNVNDRVLIPNLNE